MRDEIDVLAEGWAANGMKPGQIATLELSKRVARLHLLTEQAMRAELSEFGLTYAEFDVLAALYRVGPPYRLRPSELSRALLLTSGGTSNVLQRLTTAGHIERAADPADGRSRWVQLTGDGRRVAARAMAASVRIHDELVSGLPDDTVRQAADVLRDVLAVVARKRLR
jgi:DNA-binding MarR family transcriptional regulator